MIEDLSRKLGFYTYAFENVLGILRHLINHIEKSSKASPSSQENKHEGAEEQTQESRKEFSFLQPEDGVPEHTSDTASFPLTSPEEQHG